MYPYKYYRYINLPQIPVDILKNINFNVDEYTGPLSINYPGLYQWSDSFNKEINSWCQQHICDEMYWAFQIIRGDMPVHVDHNTKTKFCYLLNTGGDNVTTNFYDNDKTTIVDSVTLDLHRWHILKVDSYHGVTGVEPGKVRFSITGKIF